MKKLALVFLAALALTGCGRSLTDKEQRDAINECHKYGLSVANHQNLQGHVSDIVCYPPEEKQ